MNLRVNSGKRREPTNSNLRTKARITVAQEPIIPFTEEYPANTRKLDRTDRKNLNAHELFNKFTAEIIKTNVIFTR